MNIKKLKRNYKNILRYSFNFGTSIALITCVSVVHAKVNIVYTSNQPNILLKKNVAHFPQLGTLLNKLRLKAPNNTLFLHGGDSFSPSAISLFDQANNIISLANIMDVSLYSIGKRELSYDVDVLSLRAQGAQFPIVSSNILDKRTNEFVEGLFEEYKFNIDGMEIAIASVMNPRTIVTYAPEFVKIINTDDVLKRIEKQQESSDVKVLMTDLSRAESIKIAESYNFDLILIANDGIDETFLVGQTVIVVGGGQDGDAVLIELELDDDKSVKVSAKVKSLSDHRPDSKITAFIDKYKLRLGYLYNEHIATAKSNFNTNRELVRTRENALANVFVDALKEFSKAQIAVINGGSIRNSAQYPVGYRFTRGDIQSEFPFGGYFVVVEMSGAEIWDMMENSVSRIEYIDGRFFHVAGMEVVYDSKGTQGSRVKSIKIGKQLLNKNEAYQMAMQDFYLKGADDYYMLKNKTPINNLYSKDRIWNIVAKYLAKKQNISRPSMNRLVDLSNNEN